MNKIALFQADGQEFQLRVHDVDGNRWVTAQDVGNALGHGNIHRLISDLKSSGEIQDGKHFSTVTVENPTGGRPISLLLSCRGVLRIAMRAQTDRAKIFRDWAEDVLYEVMETGTYTGPSLKQFLTAKQYKEAAQIAEIHISLAKKLGCTPTRARIIGVERAKADTGIDFSAMLSDEDQEATPIGERYPDVIEFVNEWKSGQLPIPFGQCVTGDLHLGFILWCKRQSRKCRIDVRMFGKIVSQMGFESFHTKEGSVINPNSSDERGQVEKFRAALEEYRPARP